LGISALTAAAPDGAPFNLATDTLDRAQAMRYSQRLLSGSLSADIWASISLGIDVHQVKVSPRKARIVFSSEAAAVLAPCEDGDDGDCNSSVQDESEAAEAGVDDASDMDDNGTDNDAASIPDFENGDACQDIWNDSEVVEAGITFGEGDASRRLSSDDDTISHVDLRKRARRSSIG